MSPCWCLSLRPLYYITLLLSVTFLLVPFHLTSDIPRTFHLYFSSYHSSSSIFPHGYRVRTLHVIIVVMLCVKYNYKYNLVGWGPLLGRLNQFIY